MCVCLDAAGKCGCLCVLMLHKACVGLSHLAVEPPASGHAAKLVEQGCEQRVASAVLIMFGRSDPLQAVGRAVVRQVEEAVVGRLVGRLLGDPVLG